MVKLTPELIDNSRQYINPVRDRELDLRGFKIPAIENLGATYDQFDTIDFTENDLKKLENFPFLNRLKCLILNSNRISFIDAKLGDTIPNVHTVILTNNNLQELGDLDGLASLTKLEHLSLLGNPVTHKAQYRLYVVHKLPNLRVLDYRRIKLVERTTATSLFKGKKGTALKEQIVKKSKTFNIGELPAAAVAEKKLHVNGNFKSPQEIKAIQEAIANAKTLDEINRLQEMLQSGVVPGTKTSGNHSVAAAGEPPSADAGLEMEQEEDD